MTIRRVLMGVAALVAAAAFGWLVMTGLGRLLRAPARRRPSRLPKRRPSRLPPGAVTEGPRIKATLFFASEDGQRLVGVAAGRAARRRHRWRRRAR